MSTCCRTSRIIDNYIVSMVAIPQNVVTTSSPVTFTHKADNQITIFNSIPCFLMILLCISLTHILHRSIIQFSTLKAIGFKLRYKVTMISTSTSSFIAMSHRPLTSSNWSYRFISPGSNYHGCRCRTTTRSTNGSILSRCSISNVFPSRICLIIDHRSIVSHLLCPLLS